MASTSTTTNFTSTSSSSTSTSTHTRVAPKPAIFRQWVEKSISRPISRPQLANQHTNNVGAAPIYPPAVIQDMPIIAVEKLRVTKNTRQPSHSKNGCGFKRTTEYAVGPRVRKSRAKATKAKVEAKKEDWDLEEMERQLAAEAGAEEKLAATTEVPKHDRVAPAKVELRVELAERQERRRRAIAAKAMLDEEKRENAAPWERYRPVVKPKGNLEKTMAKLSSGKKSGCPNGLRMK